MLLSSEVIQFAEYGNQDTLSLHRVDLNPHGKDEIQMRHLAIGVNYIDIYHRKGVFAPKLPLPARLGVEGAGEILAVGADVAGFAVGDRLAYVGGPPGGYATHRNLPASCALHVPDGLNSAAAGGVGTLASQWLRALGVSVIGTVSTEEKAASPAPTAAIIPSSTAATISVIRCSRSPAARGSAWCMTRSGPTPSPARPIACNRSEPWSASEKALARSRLCRSARWGPRDRFTSPARRLRIIRRIGPTTKRPQTGCFRRWQQAF